MQFWWYSSQEDLTSWARWWKAKNRNCKNE